MDRFLRHDFRPALTAACGSLGRSAMLALDLGKFIHSQDFRSSFPHIFVVARSVLCLVPASCQPESVFSTTRWTLGTYSHKLGPETTEARVILHRVAQEFDSVVDASRHAMRQAGSAGCEPRRSSTTAIRLAKPMTACNTFAAMPATFQLLSEPLSEPFENDTTGRQRMVEAPHGGDHRHATPPAHLSSTPAASKAAGSSGKRKRGAATSKRRRRRKKKKKKRRRHRSSDSSDGDSSSSSSC